MPKTSWPWSVVRGAAMTITPLVRRSRWLHRPFEVRVVTGVPEPATWAMMIVGFGLVGSALRRRVVATA